MNAHKWLPALAAALTLTACSGLLPKSEPFDVYRLPPPAAAASAPQKVDWQLKIDTPAAARMLSGSRIAVVHQPATVSVYAGARWADPVPKLVRDQWIAAFRADGRVAMVSSDEDGLETDFELGANLGAFQSVYSGGPTPSVTIRFDAWLLASGSARPIANRRFSVTEAAGKGEVTDVVAAFGRAMDRLDRELVDWTIAEANAAHQH